jgi:hypothetical protein
MYASWHSLATGMTCGCSGQKMAIGRQGLMREAPWAMTRFGELQDSSRFKGIV